MGAISLSTLTPPMARLNIIKFAIFTILDDLSWADLSCSPIILPIRTNAQPPALWVVRKNIFREKFSKKSNLRCGALAMPWHQMWRVTGNSNPPNEPFYGGQSHLDFVAPAGQLRWGRRLAMSVYFLARYLGIQFCTIVCGTHNQHYWALICMLSSVFMISDGKNQKPLPLWPEMQWKFEQSHCNFGVPGCPPKWWTTGAHADTISQQFG